MKRKTSDVPTRIYSYGCFPPTTNADIVEDQFSRAGRYRNALVEIERWRRDEIMAIQRDNADLGPLLERVADQSRGRQLD